jgi:DNA-binding transcriptional ArsR family regulator
VTTGGLDPVIHAPARLRIVATLAALPDGGTVSFTRLQDMTRLTPGNLITHLRNLEDAGYVRAEKTGSGAAAPTAVALTDDGRAALERYTAVLRPLAAAAARADHRPPRPGVRIGDADRDAAAAALAEHFAHGRLTPGELDARLDVTFAATTHGEISQATWDLPDVTVLSVTSSRRDRARQRHRLSPAASQPALPRRRGRTGDGSS